MSKPALDIQLRDILVLRTLLESRIATSEHLSAIHFDNKPEATKKRLQKLKAAGFIGERKRRVYERSVLFLTREGFQLLEQKGVLEKYPPLSLASLVKRAQVSDLTILHELEVVDVKTAFHLAAKKTACWALEEFSSWPLLHQFKAIRPGYGQVEVLVKPDGFIRMYETEKDSSLSEHTFFLELDRSTEVQETLVSRATCYLEYYRSGNFAVRNGGNRSTVEQFPFRLLIVLQNAERRNNVAERLLQQNPPILTHSYLSTFAEVKADPFGKIWMRPVDYRDATSGTRFEVGPRPQKNQIYKRQIELERHIEQHVGKSSLVD